MILLPREAVEDRVKGISSRGMGIAATTRFYGRRVKEWWRRWVLIIH